jgi:hypothetical protein
MGKPEKCTVKEILKAIENSGGIKENVARKLNVSRHTVTNYQRKHPKIAQALKDELDTILDKAESNIFTGVKNGDISVSQWILRYKGGYVEKTEQKVEENVHVVIERVKSKKDEKDISDN